MIGAEAAPAASPRRARERSANIQVGPRGDDASSGRSRRLPFAAVARANVVRVVRLARLIRTGSGARWAICIALAKYHYAVQGVAIPKDLRLH